MNRSIYAVVNPASGRAGAGADLRDAPVLSGRDVTWLETTEDDPGPGQTREAIAREAGTIVVLGGDGTVRAVLQEAARSGIPLAVVPAGTGNLLATNLDLPDDPEEALGVAVEGRDRKIDVGYVNDDAFAVMAGTGIDAAMIDDADAGAKRRFGKLAYVVAALRHLRDPRFTATVDTDGDRVFSGSASGVLVANLSKVMSGVELFPDGTPDDGRLEVAVVRATGLWDWVKLAVNVLLRRGDRSPAMATFSGTDVVVRLDRPRPYEVDGEVRPAADELHFRVDPGALVVRVPGGS